MANFEEGPMKRAWETPEEISERLFKKREIDPKNFTTEDEEKLEHTLKRLEEMRSSSDASSEKDKKDNKKDSHYPENIGNYL